MKAITTKTRKTEWEFSNGKAETSTVATIRTMKEKDQEKCNGQMGQFTLVNGFEESNMEKER